MKKKPAKNHNLLLRIPQATWSALDAFGEATGAPRSSFIVQMLDEAVPMLKMLTAAALEAKQGQSLTGIRVLQGAVRSAIAQSKQHADQMDLDIEQNSEKAVVKARPSSAGGSASRAKAVPKLAKSKRKGS